MAEEATEGSWYYADGNRQIGPLAASGQGPILIWATPDSESQVPMTVPCWAEAVAARRPRVQATRIVFIDSSLSRDTAKVGQHVDRQAAIDLAPLDQRAPVERRHDTTGRIGRPLHV